MTSPLWRHPVTWRLRDHVQSIDHGHFAIGCPLEPFRYLAIWSRSIRSAVPKYPALWSNAKSIGWPVAEIWPFEIISWIWWNRKYVQSIRRPRKPYPGIKHEVDRTIRCRDMAILNAKFDDVINDITRPGSKIREEE